LSERQLAASKLQRPAVRSLHPSSSGPFSASKLQRSVRCIQARAVRSLHPSSSRTSQSPRNLPLARRLTNLKPVRQCSRTSAAFWVGVLRAGPSSEARPNLQSQPRRPGSSLARAWPELGPTRSPSPSQHAARVEAAAAASLAISQQCNCARVSFVAASQRARRSVATVLQPASRPQAQSLSHRASSSA
jgi:hypothetical protein